MKVRWSELALRYKDASSGRFIKREAVTDALERARGEVKGRLKTLGEQLKAGRINLAQFSISFRDEIKALHVLSAGIAHGGKAQLSPAALGRVGADTRRQYEYANRMFRELASGAQPLNGAFFRRIGMYADASRGTFVESERRLHRNAGFDEERNVLHAAEHCASCQTEAAKGWVPIGTLTKIGARECRTNDACSIEYRKAA